MTIQTTTRQSEAHGAEWRLVRTRLHCDNCRKRQGVMTDGQRRLCLFCYPELVK